MLKIYGKEFREIALERMKKHKLTHREVGEEVGLKERTITEIVMGNRKIQFDEGLNICRLLKIDPRSIETKETELMMENTATYSEEIRYVWECKCGQFNEECEDPESYGNDEAVCENCNEIYNLINE